MTPAAFAPASNRKTALAATRQRAGMAYRPPSQSSLVINMGLEEIQKQAKAS